MTHANATPRPSRPRPLSWHGIRTVAALELRQRARTSRWAVLLGVWCLFVYGIAGLGWAATSGSSDEIRGVVAYGMPAFLVLGMALLVVPSLTATAINGDRDHGVLATLQVTQLTAADIAVGKLVAAWLLAGVLLLTTVPAFVVSLAWGGITLPRLLLALLVSALSLMAVAGIGLMFSALTVRTVASVALTYLTVAFLTVGTAILFAASMPLVTTTDAVRVRVIPEDAGSGSPPPCRWVTQQREVAHSERTWWLLAANPFVIVADAAPSTVGEADDPLGMISTGTRAARIGPPEEIDECWTAQWETTQLERRAGERARLEAAPPVWPYGLATLLLAGTGAVAVTVRRLRTPIRRLPRGIRIA